MPRKTITEQEAKDLQALAARKLAENPIQKAIDNSVAFDQKYPNSHRQPHPKEGT